jgi:hypothetical protein
MLLETEYHRYASFLTLTYADGDLPRNGEGVPVLYKPDLTDMWKSIRYHFGAFRYFAVGEYGMQADRPHYHAILWTDWEPFSRDKEFGDLWEKGFHTLREADEIKMAYCAKYTTKGMTSDDHKGLKGRPVEFSTMSRRPGIGHAALERFEKSYTTYNGACAIATYGDIGAAYRYRGKAYPLSGYMRRQLRERLGIPKYRKDRSELALKDDYFKAPIIDVDEAEKQKNKAKRKLKLDGKTTIEELRAKIRQFDKTGIKVKPEYQHLQLQKE